MTLPIENTGLALIKRQYGPEFVGCAVKQEIGAGEK